MDLAQMFFDRMDQGWNRGLQKDQYSRQYMKQNYDPNSAIGKLLMGAYGASNGNQQQIDAAGNIIQGANQANLYKAYETNKTWDALAAQPNLENQGYITRNAIADAQHRAGLKKYDAVDAFGNNQSIPGYNLSFLGDANGTRFAYNQDVRQGQITASEMRERDMKYNSDLLNYNQALKDRDMSILFPQFRNKIGFNSNEYIKSQPTRQAQEEALYQILQNDPAVTESKESKISLIKMWNNPAMKDMLMRSVLMGNSATIPGYKDAQVLNAERRAYWAEEARKQHASVNSVVGNPSVSKADIEDYMKIRGDSRDINSLSKSEIDSMFAQTAAYGSNTPETRQIGYNARRASSPLQAALQQATAGITSESQKGIDKFIEMSKANKNFYNNESIGRFDGPFKGFNTNQLNIPSEIKANSNYSTSGYDKYFKSLGDSLDAINPIGSKSTPIPQDLKPFNDHKQTTIALNKSYMRNQKFVTDEEKLGITEIKGSYSSPGYKSPIDAYIEQLEKQNHIGNKGQPIPQDVNAENQLPQRVESDFAIERRIKQFRKSELYKKLSPIEKRIYEKSIRKNAQRSGGR